MILTKRGIDYEKKNYFSADDNMYFIFASCGKQEATATAEPIPTAVESAQVELTETTTKTIESTEVVEDNTSEAEAKDESTEAEKTTEVTNIEEVEPLSEKGLAFSFWDMIHIMNM